MPYTTDVISLSSCVKISRHIPKTDVFHCHFIATHYAFLSQ